MTEKENTITSEAEADAEVEAEDEMAASGAAVPLSVILTTGDVSFTVSRALLCRRSQYFEAMLNGHFKEANQRQIFLHVYIFVVWLSYNSILFQTYIFCPLFQTITPDAMECILNYFNFDVADVDNLDHIKDIFHAANYFGLDSLCQKIENKLTVMIDNNTCFKIYQIAKEYNLTNLEPKAKSFILYSFNEIKSQISQIENIETLYWYLSHHNLYVDNEIEIFKAGCEWLVNCSDTSDDKILVILSCIIYRSIEKTSLELILTNKHVIENETARRIIEGIIHISDTYSIDGFFKDENKDNLKKYFDKETYENINRILMSKKNRVPPIRPCVMKKSPENIEIMTFNVNERKLVQYIPIPGYPWWGQNIVSWKGYTIFALCGKIKINDTWNYQVRMYNCLTEQWKILPSLVLTPRRHATAIVNDDMIYVIGGFGQFRIMLSSVHVYNIKTDEWSELPDFPEYSTCLVACFHKGNLFVSGEHLYVYQSNQWQYLGTLRVRHSAILSHNNRLYFTERWINKLFFWDRDFTNCAQREPKNIKKCHFNVAAMCKIGMFDMLGII